MSHEARNYVIFGATGGIGHSLTSRLTSSGAHVLAVARDEGKLADLGAATGAELLQADLTEPDAADRAFAAAEERFGVVHGTANCVGSLLLKPAHLTSDAEWADTITANLTTAFHVVRAAARSLPPTPGPAADGGPAPGMSVVLCSSVAARVGLANHEAIAAAKAGVIGLALASAASYAPRGMRVNCVAPGLVRTPMTARLTTNDAAAKASAAMHPVGRIGEPDDISATMAWLLSNDATWITGQVFGLDGGLSTVRTR